MPQLYLDEYASHLAGRRVAIACREGILRDHLREIIADCKFLGRMGIQTSLLHNLPKRFSNQKVERELEKKLTTTSHIRIPPEADFYREALDAADPVDKLIFLERRPLINSQGLKINTLTTRRARETLAEFGELIANVNFRDAMKLICEKIEAGQLERVHILPAGRDTIKHELFTLEGSGTMIANNFAEVFRPVAGDEEVAVVARILAMYRRAGYLRPRDREYVGQHRQRFFVTAIDGIVVGCVEQKIIDRQTVELAALAISTRFRNQRIGVFTVNSFISTMAAQGYSRFISLTRNPRLAELFLQLCFSRQSPAEYRQRQEESPGVSMYVRDLRQSG